MVIISFFKILNVLSLLFFLIFIHCVFKHYKNKQVVLLTVSAINFSINLILLMTMVQLGKAIVLNVLAVGIWLGIVIIIADKSDNNVKEEEC